MVPVLVIYVIESLHHAASDREMPEREKSFAFICTDKIISAYRTGVQVWNAITGAITRISRANIIAIITASNPIRARSSWRCDINHTFERSVQSQWWRIPLIRALLIELISDSDFSASFTKRASRGIRRFIAVHRERDTAMILNISIFVTITHMRRWYAPSPPFWRNAPREWGTVWKYHEANSAESFYSTNDRQRARARARVRDFPIKRNILHCMKVTNKERCTFQEGQCCLEIFRLALHSNRMRMSRSMLLPLLPCSYIKLRHQKRHYTSK